MVVLKKSFLVIFTASLVLAGCASFPWGLVSSKDADYSGALRRVFIYVATSLGKDGQVHSLDAYLCHRLEDSFTQAKIEAVALTDSDIVAGNKVPRNPYTNDDVTSGAFSELVLPPLFNPLLPDFGFHLPTPSPQSVPTVEDATERYGAEFVLNVKVSEEQFLASSPGQESARVASQKPRGMELGKIERLYYPSFFPPYIPQSNQPFIMPPNFHKQTLFDKKAEFTIYDKTLKQVVWSAKCESSSSSSFGRDDIETIVTKLMQALRKDGLLK